MKVFLLLLTLLISHVSWSQIDLLRSSDLPIISIDTRGQTIVDEPKITARIQIRDRVGKRNTPQDTPVFETEMGIELRGSTSQFLFPQKPYSIQFYDSSGQDFNVSVMGMPEEHDWILYAPYNDKTCLRNALSYELANRMGMYAPRTKYCELLLNGEYLGIYVWMEKIKRDRNRVDIARLNPQDTSGSELTGGYIFKIDKVNGLFTGGWYSRFPTSVNTQMFYQYEYPKGEDLHPLQKKYLEDYVDSFEYALRHIDFADSLRGYRHYIKVKSFIDYFLINELSRNVDGYRISTFLHKDKDEKLAIGPVWDFNLAWWNANYCEGYNDQGWAVDFNNYCGWDAFLIPFWWEYLMKDSSYTNQLRCRYEEMRKTLFHRDSLFEIIDRHANVIREARLRHFIRWPILGTYVWPNISPLPITYAQEIQAVKHFIDRRLLWMDQNMPGRCDLVNSLTENKEKTVELYPNPTSKAFRIHSNFSLNQEELGLYDVFGKKLAIELEQLTDREVQLHCKSCIPGLYLLRWNGHPGHQTKVVFVK